MTVEDLQELAEQEQQTPAAVFAPHHVLRGCRLHLLRQRERPRHAQEGPPGKGPRHQRWKSSAPDAWVSAERDRSSKCSRKATLYQRVDEGIARRIVDEHLVNGSVVEEHVVDTAHPFFTSQLKIVLENCGRIDAERIEEYIAVDGYQALANGCHRAAARRGD